jgi:hypothetical protein
MVAISTSFMLLSCSAYLILKKEATRLTETSDDSEVHSIIIPEDRTPAPDVSAQNANVSRPGAVLSGKPPKVTHDVK